MTSAHFIYIPMALLVGLSIGFILGSRAARESFAAEQKRDTERARVKAEREARRREREAGKAEGPGGASEPGGAGSGDPVK